MPSDPPPGARLLEAVAVMDRLRSPGGCPWDAEQTHASLVEYLIEETYETVEAIESGAEDDLREELGDLLLQVLFHSRIAQERTTDAWSIDDVADGLVDKLVSRHPHVFGDAQVDTAADVEARWQAQKAAEKGRTSVTDGVPMAMPALVLAAKLLRRAEKGGLDVRVSSASADALVADLDEEAYGDLLLGLVASGRDRGLDAETALRSALRRYRTLLRTTEGHPVTHGSRDGVGA